jgi:hypothetical protein
MIDVEEQLSAYGREWRDALPPVPPLVVEHHTAPRRRGRGALVAAALVVVLALGAVVFALTRPDASTPPTVGTPTTTEPAFVPQLDVVPLFLPIDAADIAAAGQVARRIMPRLTSSTPPTHAEIIQSRACMLGMLGVPTGRLFNFEDPGFWIGPPITPSVAAPDPPELVQCTGAAAKAAARVRKIVQDFDWMRQIEATDGDAVVHAAKEQDVACLVERGIQGVDYSRIIDPTGSSQAHPEWNSQIQTWIDCFVPVAEARVPVRTAFRETFLADHRGEVADLQRAFDDYLRATYAPAPHAKTVTTQPDLARYDGGCIRVTELLDVPPATAPLTAGSPDAALAIAQRAVGTSAAASSNPVLGEVTVSDRSSIRHRYAWVFELAGKVVVVDVRTGKVLLQRAAGDR